MDAIQASPQAMHYLLYKLVRLRRGFVIYRLNRIMAGKRVGVLIRRSPLKQLEAAEALRMALGLTLRDDEIYLFLVDGALEVFSRGDRNRQDRAPSEIRRPIETLIELKQTVVLERESLEGFGNIDYPDTFESWTRDSISRFLAECDVAIVV